MAEQARNRHVVLRKRCPHCGAVAEAEAKLPLGDPLTPVVLDLDRLQDLADRLSLGPLLALVEVVPYKQFLCTSCGHAFRLGNHAAKDMALAMLAAMQPLTPPAPKKKTAVKPPPRMPAPQPPPPASAPHHGEWEPESLD